MSKKKQKIQELQDQLDALSAEVEYGGDSILSDVEATPAVQEAAAALAFAVAEAAGQIVPGQVGIQAGEAECPIFRLPDEVRQFVRLPAGLEENGGVGILVIEIPAP